jgi:hypothetical protein
MDACSPARKENDGTSSDPSSGRTDSSCSCSSDLFGWEIDAHNPATYGIVRREANVNADGVGIGVGIGGGVGRGPTPGHVTFHVEIPEDALVKAKVGAGRGSSVPTSSPGARLRSANSPTPRSI